MPIFLDYRKGSLNLALYEPIRSTHLSPCSSCSGSIGPSWKLNTYSREYYRAKDPRDPKGRREMSPACSECYDTGRIPSKLHSGDLAFIGCGIDGPIMIGVEVKHISELVSSLSTGRLQDTQLGSMVEDYDIEGRWLLHYGRYRPSPVDDTLQLWRDGSSDRRAGWFNFTLGRRTVPYGYIEAFKCSPSLRHYGFQVARVETIQEAAEWIGVLYRTWTKPYHKHKSMNVFDTSQDIEGRLREETIKDAIKSGKLFKAGSSDDRTDPVFVALARQAHTFPGMGYERSIAAAKYFREKGYSVRDMVNAGAKEWENIAVDTGKRKIRIGTSIAGEIERFLSKK